MPADESTSFQRFTSIFNQIKQHEQVVDVSLSKLFNQLRRESGSSSKICDLVDASPEDYDKLNIPASEYARIINFSKRKNYEYCIVELYSTFSNYMKDILKEMYNKKPKVIIHKANKTMTYADISKFSNLNDLSNHMLDEIFREFEGQRSTPKLVKRILSHTNVSISKDVSNSAMMYLQLRHLIIHNKSKVDNNYYSQYKDKLPIALGESIPADYQTVKAAMESVYIYLREIDTQLIGDTCIDRRL